MNKISCICITFNRTHFLEKAIRFFENQTYPNKELIILFTNDKVTAKFAEENIDKYNWVKIDEIVQENNFFIESVKNEKKTFNKFIEGETVFIKSNKGKYLSPLPDGQFIELETADESCVSLLKYKDNHFSLTTVLDTHILEKEEGVIIHEKIDPLEIDKAYWTGLPLLNTKIRIIPAHKYLDSSVLSMMGCDVRKVNSNVSSAITLCEVSMVSKISLGAQRNLAITMTTGDYICVWDDDDCYSFNRLQDQMTFLEFTKKEACTLNSQIIMDNNTGIAYISPSRTEGWENSLLCEKNAMGYYDDLPRKEDTPVLLRLWEERKLTVMDDPFLYVYNIHRNNVSGNDHFKQILKWSQKLPDIEMQKLKVDFSI